MLFSVDVSGRHCEPGQWDRGYLVCGFVYMCPEKGKEPQTVGSLKPGGKQGIIANLLTAAWSSTVCLQVVTRH